MFFTQSARHSRQILIKLEFSRHLSKKIIAYKISGKFFQSCSMRTDVTTDRQTDMTQVIISFRGFEKILKFLKIYLPVAVLRLIQLDTISHHGNPHSFPSKSSLIFCRQRIVGTVLPLSALFHQSSILTDSFTTDALRVAT